MYTINLCLKTKPYAWKMGSYAEFITLLDHRSESMCLKHHPNVIWLYYDQDVFNGINRLKGNYKHTVKSGTTGSSHSVNLKFSHSVCLQFRRRTAKPLSTDSIGVLKPNSLRMLHAGSTSAAADCPNTDRVEQQQSYFSKQKLPWEAMMMTTVNVLVLYFKQFWSLICLIDFPTKEALFCQNSLLVKTSTFAVAVRSWLPRTCGEWKP